MASFISAVKRKLSSLLSFTSPPKRSLASESENFAPTSPDADVCRPHKRRRLESIESNGTLTPMLRSLSALSSDQFNDNSSRLRLVSGPTANCPSPVRFRLSLEEEENSFSEGRKDDDGCDYSDYAVDGITSTSSGSHGGKPSALLCMLPSDVIAQCFSYVATTSDRFGLQVACSLFRDLSNADEMLVNIDVGGDWSAIDAVDANSHGTLEGVNDVDVAGDAGGEGNVDDVEADVDVDEDDSVVDQGEIEHVHFGDIAAEEETVTAVSTGGWVLPGIRGVLTDEDTSYSACEKLVKFAAAGNMQAVYMLGMILCYCHENVNEGLSMLRHASHNGHLRSMYALSLILRDSCRSESDYHLDLAASHNFTPAWQEKLTATEMRLKFGDLDAAKLLPYLDPPCLNRLLGRHYLECKRVRKHQTSHCWNPFCGRWAYKATSSRGMENRRLGRDQGVGTIESAGTVFSIKSLLPKSSAVPTKLQLDVEASSLGNIQQLLYNQFPMTTNVLKVSRMKMCSSCRRAKYCSKLCQVYDWRSGRHKMECQFL